VYQGTAQTVGHSTGHARGNHHPSLAPYGLFHASDGPIQIAVGTEGHWQSLCDVLGIEPEVRFATNADRVNRHPELVEVLESALASRSSADVLAELESAGVPAGKIRTMDEVYAWEQTRSQGLVINVDHVTLGSIEIPGPALRWFDQSGEITPTAHRAPPTLGQHTASVLEWLEG
jgi:formyl-CoA transferase